MHVLVQSLLGSRFWLTHLETEVYQGVIRGPGGLLSLPVTFYTLAHRLGPLLKMKVKIGEALST